MKKISRINSLNLKENILKTSSYRHFFIKIMLDNLIKLWNNGFVYKDFPQILDRISHGDSSTHIAYIYRGKVFSHRFHYSDPDRYIPTEEVKKILKELGLKLKL